MSLTTSVTDVPANPENYWLLQDEENYCKLLTPLQIMSPTLHFRDTH